MKSAWQPMRVGDVLQLHYGKPLDDTSRTANGRYPAYGANGVKSRTDQYLVDRPSIIVGRKGSAGEITLTEPRFWPLDVTYYVTFDERCHDLRFLYYLLQALDLPKLAKGIKPGVNRDEVYSQGVRVPDLPTQQRVAATLDEAFEGIATARANAERNLRNARALFDSRLQAVFSQRGAGWTDRRLVEVCTLLNGRAYSRPELLRTGKYPVLRVGNFFTNTEWYYSDLELGADKYCDHGDLLYAWSASFGPRIWEGGRAIYHYHIWKVLPNAEIIQKSLLYYVLQWDVDQIKAAHGTGTTMMHVGKGSMESRVVPVPPLPAQEHVASQLNALRGEADRLEVLYERKLAALDELKRSLLHHALTGQPTERTLAAHAV